LLRIVNNNSCIIIIIIIIIIIPFLGGFNALDLYSESVLWPRMSAVVTVFLGFFRGFGHDRFFPNPSQFFSPTIDALC